MDGIHYQDGTGQSYTNGQSVTDLTNVDGGEITLYAQWQSGAYSITYNLNGGTVATSNPTTYSESTQTFTLNNPTKVGYNFIGWSGTDLVGNTNTTVTIAQGSSGNRAYTANYTPIQYQVRFNANGGSGTMSNQNMVYDTPADLTQLDFVKPGYLFTEWNTGIDGSGQYFFDEHRVVNLTTTDGDIVDLYAQWEEEKNMAELVGDRKYPTIQAAINAVNADGVQRTIKLLRNVEATSSLEVAAGKNIILDFQHFTLSNTGERQVIKNNGTLEFTNGTITSTAAFGAIDNNATGNLTVSGGRIITTGERQTIYNNGGTVEVTGNAYLSSSASDRPTISNVKPKNGNAGTVTISGGEVISLSTTTKGAIENEATGTVIITGGTITSCNAQGVNNLSTLIIGEEGGGVDTTTPIIQGATYGVTTSNSATVEFYDGTVKGITAAFNNENRITDIEDDSQLAHSTELIGADTYNTAYLSSAIARVNFNANGGTTSEPTRYVDVNDPVGSLPTATWSRHSLIGWFTDPDNGTQITASEIITGNTTFYAHWQLTEAIVTFDANGGTISESERTVNVNSAIGALPTGTKPYKTLAGWFTEASGGTQINASQIITNDVKYFAHWDAITARLIFNANGGTVSEQYRDVATGEPITTPLPIPTRTDWGFAGWFTDPVGGTRVDENSVITEETRLYAHWISDYAAQIGAVKYETVSAAARAVPTNNVQTTITLLKDFVDAVEVAANQNIFLDLQNYTLKNDGTKTGQNTNRKVLIENDGTLEIINGTLVECNAADQSVINNNARATLTLRNVTVDNTASSNKQAIYNGGGTVLITDGTVLRAKNSGSYQGADRGAIQNFNKSSSVGRIIILDATIESLTSHAIVNQAGAVLTLGTENRAATSTTPIIKAKTYGVQNAGTFNFYDGIVKGISGSISGTISDYEDGATQVDTTELIDTDTYYVTYFQ